MSDVSGAATIANAVEQVTQLKEAQAIGDLKGSQQQDTPSVETSTSTRTVSYTHLTLQTILRV